MVSGNQNFDSSPSEMNEKIRWTLQEIRKVYAENLKFWNGLYPIHLRERGNVEEVMEDTIEHGDIGTELKEFCERAKEVMPRLKEAADLSGNSRVWRKGEPLDDLPRGLRERIEKALNFGI